MAKKGICKNKTKELEKNNRLLAIALQNDRAKMEELLQENKSNASIIMFSRLKLASLSDSLMKVVTVLDETLALLQMHSSVSSSKLTPKNTLGREEFKEQVKEVLMDCIPEDEECESPQKVPNQTNYAVAQSNKRQSGYMNEVIYPEVQIDMPNKSNQPADKPKNCIKTLNEKPSVMETNKICMAANRVSNYEHSQPITYINKFEECSPAKIAASKSKRLLKNKNFTSEVSHKKVSAKGHKSDNGAKNPVWENTKKVRNLNRIINNKKSSIPLKNDNRQNQMSDGIKVLDVKNAERNGSEKNENKKPDVACTLKNNDSRIKLLKDNVSDICGTSDCEKEHKASNKGQKISAEKFKSIDIDDLAITVTKKGVDGHSSALKSLSSRINVENSKESGGKIKACQIDDLITTEPKSGRYVLTTKCYDDSRGNLQDLNSQQEMVKNLSENALPLEADKMKFQKAEGILNMQPTVLVRDILKSCKSFPKCVIHQTGNELNRFPLDLQLLEHCPSLEVVQKELIHSQDSSIGKSEAKKTRVKNTEPPLSLEDESMEQSLCEGKKAFRTRSCTINYKEPSLNRKQRR